MILNEEKKTVSNFFKKTQLLGFIFTIIIFHHYFTKNLLDSKTDTAWSSSKWLASCLNLPIK